MSDQNTATDQTMNATASASADQQPAAETQTSTARVVLGAVAALAGLAILRAIGRAQQSPAPAATPRGRSQTYGWHEYDGKGNIDSFSMSSGTNVSDAVDTYLCNSIQYK